MPHVISGVMNASFERTVQCLYISITLLFNILLTAADDQILHKAVTPPTCNRTDHFPSTVDLVFSKYNSGIASVQYLTPFGKKMTFKSAGMNVA